MQEITQFNLCSKLSQLDQGTWGLVLPLLSTCLQDRSPVYVPQGSTTLMVKTHFPTSHVPLASHCNSACLWKESASISYEVSLRELRTEVSPQPSLLKAEESHSSQPSLYVMKNLGHLSVLKQDCSFRCIKKTKEFDFGMLETRRLFFPFMYTNARGMRQMSQQIILAPVCTIQVLRVL